MLLGVQELRPAVFVWLCCGLSVLFAVLASWSAGWLVVRLCCREPRLLLRFPSTVFNSARG